MGLIKKSFSDRDPTVISLILVNLITIVIAVYERWSLGEVLVVYWFQNIIIGFFTVLRMLSLNVSVPADETEAHRSVKFAKFFMAGFFMLHYGFFHFGYYEFLQGYFREINLKICLIAVALFFVNHLYSYLQHRSEAAQDIKRLSGIMFAPYRRIVPMHVTIIFGGFIMLAFGLIKNKSAQSIGELAVLIFFLILKTVADVKMHMDEHAQEPERAGSNG